ncbi:MULTISPECIES: hypothetical protein [Bradyrhizobium]|uniref:hypothetical protein n=1 Tax=Bradyrhizobium elkanii TaxID=29448 RepID=UPI0012BCA724|nr:hypothetical protein [Bradyrhizobium elkanii]
MNTLQLLSAGLVAATMLATPALARESHLKSRHSVENVNASGRRHQCDNEPTEVGLHSTFAARLLSHHPDQFRSSEE